MMTERQRWNLLNKLDMGYSLDGNTSGEHLIEDMILDDKEFYLASKELFTRRDYMLAKCELEMQMATGREPSKEFISKLLQAKKNVEDYVNNSIKYSTY